MTLAILRPVRQLRRRLARKWRHTVWIVVRKSDGKYWAGEYRWQGKTFTAHKHLAYLWGSQRAAETAVGWQGWSNVEVIKVDFDEFSRRPRKRQI